VLQINTGVGGANPPRPGGVVFDVPGSRPGGSGPGGVLVPDDPGAFGPADPSNPVDPIGSWQPGGTAPSDSIFAPDATTSQNF
jgi:hypothetical protein